MDLVFERFFIYAVTGVTLTIVGVTELASRWWGPEVSPWHWLTVGLAVCGVAAWRWRNIQPQLTALLQGRRGEREVGRMLEALRSLGYEVFHDIRCKGSGEPFNIDHVLIGPGGVFAIETKTWSKPPKAKAVVEYDGTRVLLAGQAPDRDSVAQAQSNADYLAQLLKRMTAREMFVRPVVLFPGWWVNPQPRGCRTWVLNPEVLAAFLKKEPNRLAREDIALFADRLTVHLSA